MTDIGFSRRAFLRMGGAAVASLAIGGTTGSAFGAPKTTSQTHPLAHAYDPRVLADWLAKIYDLVRQERFSPPSAARAYGYVSVAAYEAIVAGMPNRRSLAGQLNELWPAPGPGHSNRIHWPIALNACVEQAALAAFADRSVGSQDALRSYAAQVRSRLAGGVDSLVVADSESHGNRVGNHVASWIMADGYREILGLPYTPPVGPGLWERTLPNRGAAIEPYWERVRPMALPAVDSCAPPAPVPFSSEPGSPFWEQAMTVYRTSSGLTPEQRDTALYWRDNPDGTSGLPSGHWMLIGAGVVRDRGLDLAAAAEVFALCGISLADAFTSCWTEKYRTNLLRPITYIRNVIDEDWLSFVNSPAFPEYTSGHSVGSAAAAATLSALLGETAFVDDTGLPYGRPSRSYSSFAEAAQEAAISRLYGGIHYPMAIDVGLKQGAHVSEVVLDRVNTRPGVRRGA